MISILALQSAYKQINKTKFNHGNADMKIWLGIFMITKNQPKLNTISLGN
jgi:hypothetical protein